MSQQPKLKTQLKTTVTAHKLHPITLGAVGLVLGLISDQLPLQAQSITAASDATGTVVEQNGTTFTIKQGSLSTDEQNLFHSFETFSIESNQSVNFVAQPSVQNILSRVNGGVPSVIEGLLQVSGAGQPNLYLMNPAGVLFGANAQVNLPGNLTVTTADRIGFSQDWFSAFSDNSRNTPYDHLVGAPNGEFAFLNPQGGSVVNAGNLAVAEGNEIALIGGSVINTGTLSAPGGAITIAAIPGENIVRLSQGNNLLSLEIATTPEKSPTIADLNKVRTLVSPLDLPTLLTFNEQQHATGLSVNADGSVSLTRTNSILPISESFAIASGTLTTDSTQAQGGQIGGQIAVLGDRIGILNAQISASGSSGGGNIRLGGDYQGRGSLFNANQIVANSQTTITADAINSGNGGRVIIWSDDSTAYFGHTSVRGGQTSGNGGFVEISGKVNLAFQGTVDAIAPQGTSGSLLLDPEIIVIQPGEESPQDNELTDGEILANDTEPGPIYFISEAVLEDLSGDINLVLEASDRIILKDLSDDTLNLSPGPGSIRFEITGNVSGASGLIEVEDRNDAIITNGRPLSIIGPKLALGNLSTAANSAALDGGDILLRTLDPANNGDSTIVVGNINTVGNELSGNVNIISAASVTLEGLVQTGNPNTSIIGGNVMINSAEDVITEEIQTESIAVSGLIDINSQIGNIETAGLLAGTINDITLTAANGTITIEGNPFVPNVPNANGPENNPGNGLGDGFFSPLDNDFGDHDFEDNDFGDNELEFLSENRNFLEEGDFENDGGLLSLEDDLELERDRELSGFEEFEELADEESRSEQDFEQDGFEQDFERDGPERDGSGRDKPRRNSPERDGPERDDSERDEFDEREELSEDSSEEVEDVYDAQTFEIDEAFADEVLIELEGANTQAYSNYFNADLPTADLTLESVQTLLKDIEEQSGNRSAVVYINTSSANPQAANLQEKHQTGTKQSKQTTGTPQLTIVTAQGNPVKVTLPALSADQLFQTIEKFRSDIISSARRGGDYYLQPAQQLYQWLIAPIEAELGTVDTLVFSMDEGLRTLPIAALHDGEQFLVEKYSLGMVPALSLIDPQYEPLNNAEILAMGVSDFEQLSPLPAVPVEIELINDLWPGSAFLNEGFTRQTLIEERQQSPYRLIHLATHAEFKPGSPDNSYIQLWDEQLKLSELHRLGWQYPAVDLLVLSACSTAVGSPEAEMGFAGLAIAAGVRSAMASLWSVSDVGTLALMSEFYEQLQAQPTKSEALQVAQLAMINGDVHTVDGQLIGNAARSGVAIPSQLGTLGRTNFSHPYYWSGFTMIGSPW